MKKQQTILTIIIILALLGLAALVGSTVYEERIKENKKAVEAIKAPTVKQNEVANTEPKEEAPTETTEEPEKDDYVGEEEKETQVEESKENETQKEDKDAKSIALAKKEWGDDDSASFSIEEKKNNKYYVAVKKDATVIQWYEVDTENWTISEY
ncbi:MAG: hypothetical protein BHW02_02715 [Clostridium sp. 28_12]|nr:MAG: hypothetical protein BHW02_02715 [Clostridium sp. 28_12]